MAVRICDFPVVTTGIESVLPTAAASDMRGQQVTSAMLLGSAICVFLFAPYFDNWPRSLYYIPLAARVGASD